jgi:sulfatase maturation enzyme AslB (radical SAM superfamily)
MTQEWKPSKKWNPFNSAKLLAHVALWKHIIRGQEIPGPILVTIDPTNKCNLDCSWCNAKTVRERGGEISAKTLTEIAKFLGEWRVRAVCIAGGGEPTQHDGFGELIADLMAENIRIGVVTNGTRIDDFQQMLTFCDWVGISIDAGSADTYRQLKKRDKYHSVLDQANRLIEMARGLNRPLAKLGLGNGVFWKYLVHPKNIGEMEGAANQAKGMGFKGIHFRPVGASAGSNEHLFTGNDVVDFDLCLRKALLRDDANFSVYGVQHKFTENLEPCHNFQRCMAVFMTAVFMPPSNGGEGFNLGMCCDRRGDPAMNLLENADVANIKQMWGSGHHWALADAIKPHEQCPRCTYAPHNEIFEQVIEQDNMTLDFI